MTKLKFDRRKALDQLAARWSRLGVMFNVPPDSNEVDLERLLLDTARAASGNSRLVLMAVTWLARHGAAVARHRLARLIRQELEPDYQPVMGLLLDLARDTDVCNRTRFASSMRACRRDGKGRPLAEIENRSAMLRQLSKRRASPISLKWGRWLMPFEVKIAALRPAHWVAEHNPGLYERSLAGGDLTSSILAECEASSGVIESEAELARRCGASRPAIHAAVLSLCRIGRLDVIPNGRANGVRLRYRRDLKSAS